MLTPPPRPAVLPWLVALAVAVLAGVLFHLPAIWRNSVEARALDVARELCPPPPAPSPAVLEAEASVMASREALAEMTVRLSMIADALAVPASEGKR